MPDLTPEGRRIVDEIAARHGIGSDAALVLLTALAAGNSNQAQFSHPDLGGMGQWSRGGMIMLGDMFNHGLKARVDALCTELAGLLRDAPPFAPAPGASRDGADHSGVSLFVEAGDRSAGLWPAELGAPASTGAQNDLRYAVFPATRRLVVDQGGRRRIFDTAGHNIGGVSQQQGGDQSLTFTSQHGLVRLADLVEITAAAEQPAPTPHVDAPAVPAPTGTPPKETDVFAKIERLAELRRKEIITEAEFTAKKTELLARL